MQVRVEELAQHLANPLKPIFLVSGEETLLVEEACDQILATARAQGFTERSVHHVETGFKWAELTHDTASMSLFGDRKVLDVRLDPKRFDKAGSEAIREWIDNNAASSETLLLLRTNRLDARQRKAAWFNAIEKAGTVVLIWKVEAQHLPRWIKQRLSVLNLQVEPDALMLLSDRVEGNLLAADQEIKKLAMQDLEQPITLDTMVAALDDTSRFSTFDLLDAVMLKQPQRVIKILSSLKEEGAAPLAILGALTSQLRRRGDTRGLPPNRKKVISQFMARIQDVAPVLDECAVIDQQVKGQLRGDAWISLEKLLLRLAALRAVELHGRERRALSL